MVNKDFGCNHCLVLGVGERYGLPRSLERSLRELAVGYHKVRMKFIAFLDWALGTYIP